MRTADGRVVLEVPPGAVPSDTVITITKAAAYFDDGAVVPDTVYEFSPDGIVFSAPVAMTISYDASRIPAGIAEAELRIHKARPSSWTSIDDAWIDPGTHAAHARISGFSAYGVRARGGSGPPDDAGTDASIDGAGDASSDGGDGGAAAPVGTFVASPGFTTALGHVRAIGAHVYWSGFSLGTGAGIKRVGLAGGAVEDVVASHPEPIWGLTTDGTKLLFADEENVIRAVALGGGAATFVAASTFASDGDLVTDGDSLYWAGLDNETDASIVRTSATTSSCIQRAAAVDCAQTPSCDPGERLVACSDQGMGSSLTCCGPLQTFALRRSATFPLSRARRLVLDGDHAYWTECSTDQAWVLRKPLAGGAVETVATESVQNNNANTFQNLAVAGGRVYWSRVLAGGGLFSAPVTGGTPKKEASGEAWQVRSAGGAVYFSGAIERSSGIFEYGIFRISASGGPVETIARSEAASSMRTDFALTASEVYFFDAFGTGAALKRIAR